MRLKLILSFIPSKDILLEMTIFLIKILNLVSYTHKYFELPPPMRYYPSLEYSKELRYLRF